MKLAVIGSRTFNNYTLLSNVLSSIWEEEPFELVSGGAAGADSLAEKWYNESGGGISTCIIRPNYDDYGKNAPLIRNKKIADIGERGVAFWDGKSRGTLNAISEFAKRGKQVNIIGFGDETRRIHMDSCAPTKSVAPFRKRGSKEEELG